MISAVRRIRWVVCLLVFVFIGPVGVVAAEDSTPNIIFMIADDLGWADVAFHGGRVPTPNIDRLASRGAELTQHYVYPVCSPTRASLLSGRYATRFGVTSPTNARAFPWETITLAKALKSVGYDTALIGKWHLGSKPEEGPQKFGFDHGYGSLAGGVGPWDHRYKQGPYSITWHRNGQLIEEEGHVTDLLAKEAVTWLESRTDRPFFLYLPFTAVHLPIREPQQYLARVPDGIDEPQLREYAACIIHLDDAVGRVMEALEKTGKTKSTLVIFTSDNGGSTADNANQPYPPDHYVSGKLGGDNRPLRAEKGSVYEGGVRVPTAVYWPGKVERGKVTTPVHISDWMPTLCALAGYRGGDELRWDGKNIWPIITGESAAAPHAIYIAGPGFRAQALREGDWKLVIQHPAKGKRPQAEKVELFNIAEDPNESVDLATKHPDKVTAMRSKLAQIARADRDAQVKD